jgi:hypothetical protein
MEKKYIFGLAAVLEDAEAKVFSDRTEAAKEAQAAGFGFILDVTHPQEHKLIGWNIKVLSKAEALQLYACDGDKKTILKGKKESIWIVAPVKGLSDMIIPFGGKISSVRVVKPESIL